MYMNVATPFEPIPWQPYTMSKAPVTMLMQPIMIMQLKLQLIVQL